MFCFQTSPCSKEDRKFAISTRDVPGLIWKECKLFQSSKAFGRISTLNGVAVEQLWLVRHTKRSSWILPESSASQENISWLLRAKRNDPAWMAPFSTQPWRKRNAQDLHVLPVFTFHSGLTCLEGMIWRFESHLSSSIVDVRAAWIVRGMTMKRRYP